MTRRRILHLADLHFGAEDQTALDVAAQAIQDDPPDLLVVAGDLTQRGAPDEFEAACRWLEAQPVATISVPGNHDTPLLNMVDRVKRPFDRYHTTLGHIPSRHAGNGLYVAGFNTARGWQARRNWAEGSVRLDDLAALIDDAPQAEGSLAALVCHHPFIAPPGAPLRVATRRGRRADAQVAESPVELLLTGHVHVPSVVLRNTGRGTYVCATAGTLSQRTRNEPPGFNEIIVTDDQLQIIPRHIEGRRLHADSEWLFARTPHGPHALAP